MFRCLDQNGNTQFSDVPCDHSSQQEVYQPKVSTTAYKSISVEYLKKQKNKTNNKSSRKTASCPHFTSQELRTLRVKRRYQTGLSMAHIQRRHGKADETSSSGNKEKWKYHGENKKREFKFKNGCLTSWKEKWVGEKSRISKYQD